MEIKSQKIPLSPIVSDRHQRYEAETAAESTVTRIRIENESNKPNTDDVNNESAQRDATNTNDATHHNNEMNESQRVSNLSKHRQKDENIPKEKRNENYENTNETERVPDLPRQRQRDEAIPSTDGNDIQENDDLENNFFTGGDITVPGISENDEREKANDYSSPRGGKCNLRPNHTLNYTDEYRY